MTLMAIDLAVFARRPFVPGVVHDMATNAEPRVVLRVVVGFVGADTGHEYHQQS